MVQSWNFCLYTFPIVGLFLLFFVYKALCVHLGKISENRHQFSSVTQSCPTLWPHESQHARPPCPSPTARIYPIPCPLSQWCHPTISSSFIPFSSCLQSFPASESFTMSQLFTSDGQSIGASASASASVLSVNIQSWFFFRLSCFISLLSKGSSRVFSTTIWMYKFLSVQPSL